MSITICASWSVGCKKQPTEMVYANKRGEYMPKLTKKELKSIFRAMSLITALGVSMVACIALGIFIGWLLDRWFGTSPWLILIFSILGAVAAFKTMYEMCKHTMSGSE